MSFVLVQHKVEDYARWKTGFDAAADLRKANGELSAQIFRSEEDPNSVTGLFAWDTLENARKYFQMAELKEAMQKAGVAGPPTISYLNEG